MESDHRIVMADLVEEVSIALVREFLSRRVRVHAD
jgi:hypothetical protein